VTTTVVKVIGTGGDYTTLQAWEDAAPADLTTADQIWQGQCKNQLFSGAGVQLTMAGSTSDATRYKELTTQSGASFRDNANVQTNALRYNSSNGAAISNSGGYTTAVLLTENYSRLTGLQVEATANSGGSVSMQGTGNIVRQCICEHKQTDGFAFAGNSGTAVNVLVVSRKSAPSTIVKVGAVSGALLVNCTIVQPTGLTAPSAVFGGNYGTATVKNCAMFANGAPVKSGSTAYTFTTCYSDASSPPTGVSSATYNTSLFTAIANTTHDYRLPSGSSLIDVGTTDSTNAPTDIAGTSRPAGSAYDVGAWEFASGVSTINASGTITEAGDTASGAGTLKIAGSANITSADDTLSATMGEAIAGSGTITNADDTSSGAAGVSVSGSGTPQENDDTSAAAAGVKISGSGTITEGDDTLDASSGGTRVATGTVNEDDDTIAGIGHLDVTAAGTTNEASDTATGAGVLPVAGAATVTEQSDTGTGAGAVKVSGTGTTTEGDDSGSAFGSVPVTGSGTITEDADTLGGHAFHPVGTERPNQLILKASLLRSVVLPAATWSGRTAPFTRRIVISAPLFED
jgi:hypothetical protein